VPDLLVLWLVVDQSEVTATTIMTIEVVGHKDAGATFLIFAFTSETGNFAIVVHLVEFQNGQLDLLLLMLVLFGSSVILLLALLGTTTKSKNKVEGGLLLNVIVREGSAVFKLFTSEDQSLLVRRDALFVLNFSLHILNSIRGLDLKGDGLTREGFDENLHAGNC